MSKKKPTPSGPVRPAPAKAAPARKAAPVELWPTSSDADALLRKIFWGIAALALGIMLWVAPATGINSDDEFQNDYSQKLLSYYSTVGKDTAALYIEKGMMHNYGGFFDLLTGVTNAALGFEEYEPDYHHTRHIFIALFGLLAMIFTGLLAKEIAGWRTAILALLLVFLSPRFFGHSMMNPKDIPFAAGFAIALYFMVRLLGQLPVFGWKNAFGLTLGIALAFASRAGGLLLIPYLVLFAGVDFLSKYGIRGLTEEFKNLKIYAAAVAGVAVSAYILAILTWPAALTDPLGLPLRALAEFSQLGIKIRLLFQGENLMSDQAAWYYPIVWIVKTIPLSVLVGFLGALVILPFIWRRWKTLPLSLVYFAAIFPVFYVIYKNSVLHDDWRHLLFIYPALVVCAALFWTALERLSGRWNWGKYVVWVLLAVTTLDAAIFLARNSTLAYVYFNPIGGGLKGAFGYYETDYWGISVKQAIGWMEKEGILSAENTDTVVIGTNLPYNVARQLKSAYRDRVKVRFARYDGRYAESWEYGIFTSRFVNGDYLRDGNWPNTKTVHVISANGVPLAAIERDTTNLTYKGIEALKAKNWEQSIALLTEEIRSYPDNESARLGIAYCHYYIAENYMKNNQPAEALSELEKSIAAEPTYKPAYEMAALIYQQQGDEVNARRFFDAASKLK